MNNNSIQLTSNQTDLMYNITQDRAQRFDDNHDKFMKFFDNIDYNVATKKDKQFEKFLFADVRPKINLIPPPPPSIQLIKPDLSSIVDKSGQIFSVIVHESIPEDFSTTQNNCLHSTLYNHF